MIMWPDNIKPRTRAGSRTARLMLILLAILATQTLAAETEPLDRILESARLFLSKTLADDPGGDIRIELGQLDSRLRLARCTHRPTARLAPGARTEGSTTVNVRCSEPVNWSIFVPVRIERHVEVIVAARALARDQVIRASDIRLERQESSQLLSGYFSDPGAVLGLQTKRRLLPGQVLTKAQVEPRQLVERGQEVTLYAARPGLTVRMKGEALESGSEGERIRVRNRSSRRIVEGYVEPSGAVRVAL